ncbi:MAG: hypothetical protein NE334_14580 [Lentisphaeraceae bacterium]|nr:hypothetical protein [Lentisphaeraceae bacterium]
MSERYVKRLDGGIDECSTKLFDWVEKYHRRHTSITLAISEMNSVENASIEIIKDYGEVPD